MTKTGLSQMITVVYPIPILAQAITLSVSERPIVWVNGGIMETSIKIFIKAPWWQSTIATYCYILLFLIGVITFIYLYDRTQKKRYAQKQILADNQREKDIYNAKIEFFTDIAHEIRTPLILINGPLEAILEENEIDPPAIRKNMRIMEQNVKRLLDLINQLLDFRKIDERKFILNPTNTNLNNLVIKTINRFPTHV